MVEDEWQADHGAGDSKKQDSGCQDWAQVACSTHGMLSQRGYPVCAGGSDRRDPGAASTGQLHIQLRFRIFQFLPIF